MSLVYVDTSVPMKRHVPTPTSVARQFIADGRLPLATLDAIHLATALAIEADALATDDRQLARAAKAQRLAVVSFL